MNTTMDSASINADHLLPWIGKTEIREDILVPSKVSQWAAVLDKTPQRGDQSTLPPLAHWIFFTPQASQTELGIDGHPELGGFLPPVSLPRRMWAGGRLVFRRELSVNQLVSRETTIKNIQVKEGRQGSLVFLTLLHRIGDAEGCAIEEEQDLVYRARSAETGNVATAGPIYDEPTPEWEESITPNETLLFRYSALTFNAHRIHYDLPYAQEQEGYASLVVQGPLTATLLMDCATRWLKQLPVQFSFRGVSPLFVNQPITLCAQRDGHTLSLWALGPDNRIGMTAQASLSGVVK